MMAKSVAVKHPHIERRPGVCGGELVIKGTRITVALIASYYYDNKEEIDRYRQENSEEHVRQKYKGVSWMK